MAQHFGQQDKDVFRYDIFMIYYIWVATCTHLDILRRASILSYSHLSRLLHCKFLQSLNLWGHQAMHWQNTPELHHPQSRPSSNLASASSEWPSFKHMAWDPSPFLSFSVHATWGTGHSNVSLSHSKVTWPWYMSTIVLFDCVTTITSNTFLPCRKSRKIRHFGGDLA